MLWYENIKPTKIYDNLSFMFNENPNLYNDECVIFIVNTNSGFGSQLTLLIQNSLYLNKINPKIHSLGHFSSNNYNFKYHDDNYNNSFFLYFKYLKNINDDINYYFVNNNLCSDLYPFIEVQNIDGLNVDNIEINKTYSDYFKKNFELKIGNNIINNINTIKEETKVPLIGIHMRSIMQIISTPFGRDTNIEYKFLKIKNQLDKVYVNYNIFFITDVYEYINLAKNIFKEKNVYYNDYISRIQNDKFENDSNYSDSIINLNEYTGFKLGSDIIYDCLSLVNCDKYYVSITNIAYITSFISNKNNGIHFN